MWNQRQAWDSKVLTQSSSPDLALHGMASLPGFRFQPTDEELVGFYLKNMVTGNRTEVELINVLDLYRYDPWELPGSRFGSARMPLISLFPPVSSACVIEVVKVSLLVF